MASMNKPSSGDPDWYQAVTDNWTSIEKNLIDKSIVTTKGDVLGSVGLSTPGRVAVGTDGQYLVADSSPSTGLAWGPPNVSIDPTDYMDKLVYDTRFFSAAGLLPATKHYETAMDAAPTPDFDTTGVTPTVVGTSKRWPAFSPIKLIGWDLGAQRQRILMIFSDFWSITAAQSQQHQLYVSDSSGDFAAGKNGYSYTPLFTTYFRFTNGVATSLTPTNYIQDISSPFGSVPYGVAFLFDNGNIRLFYRFGNFQWIEGSIITDGTYTTLRYAGMRFFGRHQIGPVSVWYDA